MTINNLEREILNSALGDANPRSKTLIDQIRILKVKEREYTGVGFYVDFDDVEKLPQIYVPDEEIATVRGKSSELKNGFGCVVFIRNRQIRTLECFSYDEVWPEDLGKVTLERIEAKPVDGTIHE